MIISNSRPRLEMTIPEWNKRFDQMRKENVPTEKKFVKAYRGKNDDPYATFINSVLKNIRRGEIEYCYYEYQVVELLRFEPDIHCLYNDEGRYFTVWLDSWDR